MVLTFKCTAMQQIDLQEVKTRYAETYQKTLANDVTDECSGDFRRLLLVILDEDGLGN